ncbi:MAG TPA: hypothetical protein DF774_09460 [Rheinheimera sp.]|nr:hypothetical protein [Rheinheimera sp.]
MSFGPAAPSKSAPADLVLYVACRTIARAWHSHATNWPGANLDRFSKQSTVVRSEHKNVRNVFAQLQAGPAGTRHRRCRTIPSSARDIKAPNKATNPTNPLLKSIKKSPHEQGLLPAETCD